MCMIFVCKHKQTCAIDEFVLSYQCVFQVSNTNYKAFVANILSAESLSSPNVII